MGTDVREALGTVACLWRNSQDLIKTHGTKNEIIEWSSLFKLSDEVCEKWILALEKARFISRLENDDFKIHGNEIQIENRIAKTHRASKGAKALQKKLREMKALQAGSKQASSKQQAGSKPLNAMQFNAMQDNSIQCSSVQGKTKQSKKLTLAKKTESFIARYCENFKLRYGSNPVIKGKDAGIAKRLAANLTEEKAWLYLDAYFQMPDAQLVKAKHPMNLLELKFNEVTVFAESGNFMTHRQAQQADDMASNALLLEQVRRGEL
jgi:hypothetical protein